MKRKLIYSAFLLAIVFALASCGGNNAATADTTDTPQATQGQDRPPADDVSDEDDENGLPPHMRPMAQPITLNIGASFGTPEGNVPAGTTPETQTFNQLLQEHMNITLNYMWLVPSAQGQERFELAIATGEIPDIMTLGRRDFAEFTEFGMLRDLTDAFERYIHPDIRAMFEYNNNASLEFASRDGRLFGIPEAPDPMQQTQLIWYRHDWMEALGLSIPRSMDDLINMALAFVENDMSGQGNTTGIGMQSNLITTWVPDARGIFHGHGAYPFAWLLRDGELVPGIIQPEVQDALNTMRHMYEIGVLNPEFATMNLDQLVADIVGDRVGIVFGEWWLPNWPFNSALEANPDTDWRATTIVTPEGTPGTTIMNRMNVQIFRTVSADAPPGAEEALIRMINLHWDIAYNPDAREIYGELIEPENGWVHNWAPAFLTMAAFGQYLNYNMLNEARITGDTSEFFNLDQWELWEAHRVVNEGYVSERMEFPQAWGLYTSRMAHHGGWGLTMQVRDAGLFIFNEFYGNPTPTELAVASILSDMWGEFAARYIMGDLPYEAWDTFVTDWLRLGGGAWAQEANEQFRAMQ